MTLEDLFKKLSYGELSNLAVAVDGTGAIKKEQQNRIVHFANEGLLRLHSRIPLLESIEDLSLTGVDVDHLMPVATTSRGDAFLVTALLTSYGQSLTIGNRAVPDTIYVLDRKLHLPYWIGTVELKIFYQHLHLVLAPITGESPGLVSQTINLMTELEEALTAYIASKIYRGMNSQDSMALSQMYLQRYEQVIAEVLGQGLLPGELLPSWKFDARGFV